MVINRFPLAYPEDDSGDIRQSSEAIEGLTPYTPFEEPLPRDECARAGLPHVPLGVRVLVSRRRVDYPARWLEHSHRSP